MFAHCYLVLAINFNGYNWKKKYYITVVSYLI